MSIIFIFIFIFECNKIFIIKIKTYSVYQIKLINHKKNKKKKKPINIKSRAQNTAHTIIKESGRQDKFKIQPHQESSSLTAKRTCTHRPNVVKYTCLIYFSFLNIFYLLK